MQRIQRLEIKKLKIYIRGIADDPTKLTFNGRKVRFEEVASGMRPLIDAYIHDKVILRALNEIITERKKLPSSQVGDSLQSLVVDDDLAALAQQQDKIKNSHGR